MKPVLIFEHITSSNPGLFSRFLDEHAIPYQLLYPNQGDTVPPGSELSNYSGLCFLGGIESVVNPTSAMQDQIKLIRHARQENIPMIGHCLGGQLISQALGGEVSKHEVEEFGWSRLLLEQNPVASSWLPRPGKELLAMQWHSDSFSIPDGATRILSGVHCSNQAFVYDNILAMQFHIEIDMTTIRVWAENLKDKHPPESASVQSGESIMELAEDNFRISKDIAYQLYSKWVKLL